MRAVFDAWRAYRESALFGLSSKEAWGRGRLDERTQRCLAVDQYNVLAYLRLTTYYALLRGCGSVWVHGCPPKAHGNCDTPTGMQTVCWGWPTVPCLATHPCNEQISKPQNAKRQGFMATGTQDHTDTVLWSKHRPTSNHTMPKPWENIRPPPHRTHKLLVIQLVTTRNYTFQCLNEHPALLQTDTQVCSLSQESAKTGYIE
jgi:hypothetical protein